MLYGIKAGDTVLVVDDPSDGKPIVETAAPGVPEGYYAAYVWEDQGSQIVQVWSLKPIGGTQTDAAIKLAEIQAQTLEDADALQVPMLYSEWIAGETYKAKYIIRYKGELYRLAQDTVSSDVYPPDAEGVESIYTHITVDEETGYETWQQPTGAHDAYPKDKIVKDPNDGKLYKSTFDGANVWGPPSTTPDYWELYVEE